MMKRIADIAGWPLDFLTGAICACIVAYFVVAYARWNSDLSTNDAERDFLDDLDSGKV